MSLSWSATTGVVWSVAAVLDAEVIAALNVDVEEVDEEVAFELVRELLLEI